MQIQSGRTVPLRRGIFLFFCFQFDRIPVKFPHTTGYQTLGKKLPLKLQGFENNRGGAKTVRSSSIFFNTSQLGDRVVMVGECGPPWSFTMEKSSEGILLFNLPHTPYPPPPPWLYYEKVIPPAYVAWRPGTSTTTL